jgi:hypothetical protein
VALPNGRKGSRVIDVKRFDVVTCCAIVLLGAGHFAATASASERMYHATKGRDAILCIAGCDSPPPVVVGRAPMTRARPLSLPADGDITYRMRNVWCADGGSCVAVNHIAPPRLRDGHETTISVFYRRW